MSADPGIVVRPIAGALGAEVEGVSLARVDDAGFAQLHAAFLAHQVLFFRDQEITREQQKAFACRFGTLHIHPFLQPLKELGHPEFVVLESDAAHPYVAEAWHSDVTFAPAPPLGSLLRCVVAPEYGGDTMWASMYAAYEALSDRMQRLLSDLVAVHDTSKTFSRPDYRIEHIGGQRAREPLSAEHPVIRTHPETRRKALFVNATFTTSIKGMKSGESRALLEFLFRHIETPDFSCRFRWRSNSLALWDNRCTQHRVVADHLTAPRRMERVTINGDRPF
ncbi:MAG TPA: TauD/TfdA family dioxygenase [Candidatus Binataceae bacterium]|nr:TauD/TfdA family dioxygenase [Candidatus Binataceae bacterium]